MGFLIFQMLLKQLTDQPELVKKGGVMASSYVGGLSGAFIPVSEDQGMIDAVNRGALTLEKLEGLLIFKTMYRRWNSSTTINKFSTSKLIYWHNWCIT